MPSARMPGARIGPAATALGAAAVIGYALLGTDDYSQQMLIWISLNTVVAVGLRFVMLVGETNIATGAFYGIAAYVAAIATTKLTLPFAVALLSGGLIATAVSAVFGAITLRTKGPYFMLISFGFTEVMRMIYTRIDYIGGNSGMIGIFPPKLLDPFMPALTVVICGALVLMLYLCERSNLGKIFKGIKNNDAVIETVGIDVLHVKLICLVLASLAIGIAGALHAHTYNVISPGDFSFLVPVFALAYVKIGGNSHVLGSVIGTALLTVVAQGLQGTGSLERILFGAVIVLAMLVMPDGLLGLAKRLFRLATGRRAASPVAPGAPR